LEASASAVQPSNLPNTLPKAFTGKSEGTSVYHGDQGDIVCTVVEGTGEETSNEPPAGTFHGDARGCELTSLKSKCTGLGESTAGTVLALGTWSLVFDREVGHAFTGLTTATLSLVNLEHASCGALILLETKGEVLCLDLKPTEANATHSAHCTAANSIEPNEEWCMGGEDVLVTEDMCIGEWLRPKLEHSVNHGAFKPITVLALGNATSGVAITGMI
jgi:hypothetical protein